MTVTMFPFHSADSLLLYDLRERGDDNLGGACPSRHGARALQLPQNRDARASGAVHVLFNAPPRRRTSAASSSPVWRTAARRATGSRQRWTRCCPSSSTTRVGAGRSPCPAGRGHYVQPASMRTFGTMKGESRCSGDGVGVEEVTIEIRRVREKREATRTMGRGAPSPGRSTSTRSKRLPSTSR